MKEGTGQLTAWREASLEDVQRVGDYLLSVAQGVCDRLGIDLYLDGGNLLGAVRSGTWIPWDDDVDTILLREDYERFRSAVSSELPSDISFSDPVHSKGHATQVARLCYLPSRLKWTERLGITPPERQFIELDVFVADVAPSSAVAQQAWLATLRGLQLLQSIRATSPSLLWASEEPRGLRIAAVGSRLVLQVLPSQGLSRAYDVVARMFRSSTSDALAITNSGSLFRHLIHKREDFFENATHVTFGENECLAPNPKTFLRAKYGPDYLTPPPVEKRVGHNFQNVQIIGAIPLSGEPDSQL